MNMINKSYKQTNTTNNDVRHYKICLMNSLNHQAQ